MCKYPCCRSSDPGQKPSAERGSEGRLLSNPPMYLFFLEEPWTGNLKGSTLESRLGFAVALL